ncbi:aminoacyl-tRNA deacylase [Exiguobacterium acetylicum]|uniref:aminoacyl-tRNA deacylase n=1 Tax=Exiguobacterium sp. BMC-KP TaxID=1684312 RepID=UPI0006AA3B5E|nr:aminoacyl-tRNA deacylase [Exiguobacterium sp. BMC-KP]KOP28498.1 prolyl-tRNA synthetase [Exiguobacterium sp. BMC-KP]
MSKTNVERLLKQSKIDFESLTYPVDLDDLSAEAVARKINYPLSTIFKTLVLKMVENKYAFVVISGEEELSLKAAAKALHSKKVALVPMKDLEGLTGYVRGGVSAIGAKKNFPVLLSDRAMNEAFIILSAGKRGHQVRLSPYDFLAFTQGILFTNG